MKYTTDKIQKGVDLVKKVGKAVKKGYDSTVRPLAERYVKPAVHYLLDPVWNNPVTQWVVNNVPGAKQATNFLGKVGNTLGIW